MPRPRGKGREVAHDGRGRQHNPRGSMKNAWAEGNYVQERGEGESEDEQEDQQQVLRQALLAALTNFEASLHAI